MPLFAAVLFKSMKFKRLVDFKKGIDKKKKEYNSLETCMLLF